MFGRGSIYAVVLALAIVVVAFGTARPSQGGGPEARHVVRPGETLWAIASERYAGDPRAAVWKIEQRNGVSLGSLQPGSVLYLPP
ncbi:MAG TPA: LysM peptidoglycan-binding domain-containing protein [Gaiellaceae bacterium]